ncbi:MAG: hypothetical protein KF757_13855 [Phycisphaeraceae bacterium]|nr:hypothetical protein [Phycisphaeraceae bacterium]MCW5764047.1 hypothetical protein [Phycisphaeraceae bacterium]
MSDLRDNPDEILSEGALVRLASDGELTPAQAEALEALVAQKPELVESIAFERRMHESIGRVMGAVVTPAGLAGRVRAAIQAEAMTSERVDALAEETRKRGFWQRRQVVGAMAAAVVLSLMAGILWQAFSIVNVPLDASQQAFRQELVSFVSAEHARTAQDQSLRAEKLVLHEALEAEGVLAEKFARRVVIPDCQKRAVQFMGAGSCQIPGGGPSAHVMLQPDVGPTLSLFVTSFTGQLPMVEGKTYVVNTKACGQPGTRIFSWVEGGLVYVLVLDEVKGCERMLSLLGLAMPTRGL